MINLPPRKPDKYCASDPKEHQSGRSSKESQQEAEIDKLLRAPEVGDKVPKNNVYLPRLSCPHLQATTVQG